MYAEVSLTQVAHYIVNKTKYMMIDNVMTECMLKLKSDIGNGGDCIVDFVLLMIRCRN